VGIGTARSGTTWWDALLHAHPDVARLPGVPKEVHWFDRFWDGSMDDAAVADYARFFARPEGTFAGEWTPGYILEFWALEALRIAAPDAKLLVLLRDPVARFRSAMTLTENRLTLAWDATAAASGAFWRGLYADQLLRLWTVVPREQVLVLQYERCVADTRAELARTAAFIGLDPERMPAPPSGRWNPSQPGGFSLTPRQARLLVERYALENERLAQLVPELDLDLWARP
jgi:Sulfotransferase family